MLRYTRAYIAAALMLPSNSFFAARCADMFMLRRWLTGTLAVFSLLLCDGCCSATAAEMLGRDSISTAV